MTRKDYVLIATAIGQATKELKATDNAKKALAMIIEHVSHALQVENPAFKPGTFKSHIAVIANMK